MTEPLERLLFVTSTVPRKSGLGIAMRAGNHVEALSKRFDVRILLVGPAAIAAEGYGPEEAEWEARTIRLGPARLDAFLDFVADSTRSRNLRFLINTLRPILLLPQGRSVLKQATAAEAPYSAIFAFRIRTAPVAWRLRTLLRPNGRLLLDTDDIESHTRRLFANSFRQTLGRLAYGSERLQAWRLARAERRWFKKFHDVFVCSEKDCRILQDRHFSLSKKRFAVIPNAVRMPSSPLPWPVEDCLNVLFVGTMSYQPNVDAIVYFCDRILPILRREASKPFRVWVVGRKPPASITELSRQHPELIVTGQVPDVAEFYARSHLVVVPLRAGGGTRIKILEAMSFGRPVVSTTIGAEGLELEAGRDLLIEDDETAFARACLELWQDQLRAKALGQRGYQRCQELYSIEAITAQLDAIWTSART